LWVLSQSTRMAIPGNLRCEVMDMEGFQVDLASSWKMAMVLSLLAEIVLFCNRDARCDSLFKAADVFEKGRKLSSQFGMKPVTNLIFVQVDEGMEEDERTVILEKLKSMVPGIEIQTFDLPQLRNKNKKDHEFITFHDEMKEAVGSLIGKFKFKNTDAVAAKARSVANLLDAFNEGDFLKLADMSSEFLKLDCERLFKSHLAIYRNLQIQRALTLKLPTVDTTLEEFAGKFDPFEPDLTLSNFYVQGKSDEFIKEFLEKQEKVDVLGFYHPFWMDRVQDLRAELERNSKIMSQKERDFQNEVKIVIEEAKERLQRYKATLKFNQKIEGDGSKFLRSKEVDAKGKKMNALADYTSYFLLVSQENEALKSMWTAQIEKAKWISPCQAQGKMVCINGHKVRRADNIQCDKKVKNEHGEELVCGGFWYWVDGPENYSMCNGPYCKTIKFMDPGLKCANCGNDLLCKVRPSDFYP